MRIYIASKSVHGPRWVSYRTAGIPIASSWIDQSGVGETSDWSHLWRVCLAEASTADALVVYRENGETLKGAYLEAGAALAASVPTWYVGEDDGSVTKNLAIKRAPTVDEAFWQIFEQLGWPEPSPRDWPFPAVTS